MMFRMVSVIFLAFCQQGCFTKILLTCRTENSGTSVSFRNEFRLKSNIQLLYQAVVTLWMESVNLQSHPPTLASLFHTHSYLLHTPTNKGSILSLQTYLLSPLLLPYTTSCFSSNLMESVCTKELIPELQHVLPQAAVHCFHTQLYASL